MNFLLLPILMVSALLTLLLQILLPPVDWMHGARVNLWIVVIVYACVTLDYPWLLGFLLFTGFTWDLLQVPFHFVEGARGETLMKTGYPFGASILYFLIAGSIVHGVRGLFARGHWEVLPPLAMLVCTGQLFVEFVMISVQRQSFASSPELWWRILGPGLFVLLLTPPFILLFNTLASLLRIPIRQAPQPIFH